jgi:hypothetical protein
VRKIACRRKLTEPQKRYAAVGKLIEAAEEMLLNDAAEGRQSGLADLGEELKCRAAADDLVYDGGMVATAIDIAQRRIRAAAGASQ